MTAPRRKRRGRGSSIDEFLGKLVYDLMRLPYAKRRAVLDRLQRVVDLRKELLGIGTYRVTATRVKKGKKKA